MTSNVTWGRNTASANATRLADSYQNRALLQQRAAQDGTPSAVVKMGNDVALLSSDALRTSSRLSASYNGVISQGSSVTVDGVSASVLYTDDGFSEIDASNVIVAVVDTGIDANHPALRGRLVQGYNSYDGSSNVTDLDGHGTHVAGTIAGAWGLNDQAGGVASTAKIMPIRACDNNKRFSDLSIANGVIYAVEHGARVINLSLEDQAELPRTQLAIDYAHKMGVLVVAAAGNEGRNGVDSPAKYDGAIAVGSSRNGRRSTFSNGGDRLDLSAPGEDIVAPLPGNRYGAKSGTSMASPYVAGAAALILARHPEWTPEQVAVQLARTANDWGTAGKDNDFGYGEVNLFEAVYGGAAPSQRRVTTGYGYPNGGYQQPGAASRLMTWIQHTFLGR
ncbi:MAG: peptidase and in kexin sedolisin [Cyanobacteria bacterium RYN_339]|nr:peptidase and in kexin sedolisin [Cyanobacteria bacterium RYN_339]